MKSRLWSLQLSDWWKGLIVAVLTAPLTIIYQSISAGSLVLDWKAILLAGLAGGIAYLMKNIATGTKGRMLTNG
jgi:hypothetical protein